MGDKMTNTNDMTAMFKDLMGAFPVDTTNMQDAFKSTATLNEKLSGVTLNAVEKSADVSAKWTKETIAKTDLRVAGESGHEGA